MASAIITFCEVGGRTYSGGSVDAIRLSTAKTQVVTLTSSSQTITNPNDKTRYNYVSVTAVGGNLWVTSGLTPTANDTGVIILDGQTKDFSIDKDHKLAVITATI